MGSDWESLRLTDWATACCWDSDSGYYAVRMRSAWGWAAAATAEASAWGWAKGSAKAMGMARVMWTP